jgi:hypothetical protein
VKKRTLLAIAAAGLLILGTISVFVRDGRQHPTGADASTTSSSASSEAPVASMGAPAARGSSSPGDVAADAGSISTIASARWGSKRGELGRERQQEGNAEGPMSFAFANGKLVVLDQVNRRVTRYGKDGRVESESDAPQTAQDIAVAKNGSSALLDRLSTKSISVHDPSGKKVGELALREDQVGETGLLTGVFVDGKSVYVEKSHGALVLVGSIDGQPADGPSELAGRPSRDGKLLLNAQMAGGAIVLNAIDRQSGTSKFARAIPFPRPLRGILLLDSDTRGTIYVAASAGAANTAQIVCLEPREGAVTGRVSLPMSDGAEESMRDFAVDDDGTIVAALRTNEGVAYRTVRCP